MPSKRIVVKMLVQDPLVHKTHSIVTSYSTEPTKWVLKEFTVAILSTVHNGGQGHNRPIWTAI